MIRNFFNRVEKLFENPAFELSVIEQKRYFEINPDNKYLENISYIFSSVNSHLNAKTIFTRLITFFEVGILFQKNRLNQKSCPVSCFAYGLLIEELTQRVEFQLPNTRLFSVHKTSARGFLKKMGLNQIDPEHQLEAYYLRLSENTALVVMSPWPKPWIKPRLESLQQTLMRTPIDLG